MALPFAVRADMFAQLAAMERAGLPAAQAWKLLKLPAVAPARLLSVAALIQRGRSPDIAAQNAQLFTPMEANLVRAAMAAGSPEHAYRRLADAYSERANQQGKVRSRMVLPAAAFFLSLAIAPVPELVAGTMTAGAYLWHLVEPVLAIFALTKLGRHLKTSEYAGPRVLKIPLYGAALARENARNFYESLALLLEAGVAMFEALPIAVSTIENTTIQKAYSRIKPCMQRGEPLSTALAQEISEPMYLGDSGVIELIATGEASGTLPEMLFRHANEEARKLSHFWTQVADWVPRIAYLVVVCLIAHGLMVGGGLAPTN